MKAPGVKPGLERNSAYGANLANSVGNSAIKASRASTSAETFRESDSSRRIKRANVQVFPFLDAHPTYHPKPDAAPVFPYISQPPRLNKTPATEQPELLKLCMQGKGFRNKRVN
jgi:hypothetical protein